MYSSHVFHMPIIDHISHHKKQDDFCHNRKPPPSYDLLHTAFLPSRDMVSKVALHDRLLYIDVHKGVSDHMGENMGDSFRDGNNGPEFWSDDKDSVFGINRGNLGKGTDETPYRERMLLFFHIHIQLPSAWCMSDRRRGDKVAGMCVGHNLMSVRKSTHHVRIRNRPSYRPNGFHHSSVVHSDAFRMIAIPDISVDRAIPRNTCRDFAYSHTDMISSQILHTADRVVDDIGEGSDDRREAACRMSDGMREWGLCREYQILGVMQKWLNYASFRRNRNEVVCKDRVSIFPRDTAVRMYENHNREAFHRFGRMSTLQMLCFHMEHASIQHHNSMFDRRFHHMEGNFRNGRFAGSDEYRKEEASDNVDRIVGPGFPNASYCSEWSAASFHKGTEVLSLVGTEDIVQHDNARYTYDHKEALCRIERHMYEEVTRDRILGFPPSRNSNSTWWELFHTFPRNICYW